MKKNLLSIIILALLVVNLGMTGFMMLSVMTTNSQTAKLISDIAAALELEANGGNSGGFSGSASGVVAVTDMATWGFTGDEKLTIALKPGEDGKAHYMVVEVVFSMNKASADYATLGTEENLANVKEVVKSEITNTLASYTMEELQGGMDAVARESILENVQAMFNSNFIYDISFSSVLYS
ncbi:MULTISPECIES: flagellar basal body-associated FliL family protein [unclassified Butyrivibrio]|jgi:flagellar FliL protein|uniref:flagellar basal body-associated FliL family protein n=1 Tax=unclassified Butyrivibrio TaxID=2639466 RepID=UPI0003B50554|nr:MULTISPECIES: flagellar basal body-associated FliL family protein [unclassified Butyrivibrio]